MNAFKYFIVFLLISSPAFLAAQQTVSGSIVNQDGVAIPGASILNRSNNKGTVTDSLGRFIIHADSGTLLQISSIGYTHQQIIVTKQLVFKITLLQLTTNLDEVVTIGYGTARRKDLTGAIASVNASNFNKGNYISPDLLIQGKVSGVQVSNGNGDPGGFISVNIRGNSALTGTGQPLYVIDGIQLDGRNILDGNNALNFLNPNDIASIDILKDASATAIYGSRAAYGVVIINTKRGQAGATKMDVAVSGGFSNILKNIRVLNSTEYRQAIQYYGVDNFYDRGGNSNGMDAILQTGHQQNYYLAGSGGNQNGKYRFSAGYYHMTGIITNTAFTKYTGDISASLRLLDNKKLGLDFGVNTSQYLKEGNDVVYGNTGVIQAALTWNPTDSLRNPDGTVKMTAGHGANPIAISDYIKSSLKVTTILASISPSYKFADWLEYKLVAAINYTAGVNRAYTDQALSVYGSNLTSSGNASINENELSTEQITNTLSFHKQILDNLNLDAVVGYEYMKFSGTGFGLTAYGPQGGFGNYGIDYTNYVQYSDQGSRIVSSYENPSSELQSFFGRVIFDYQEKYLLTATLRADGSSKFGSNNKYGYFPSAAFAWNISKEKFFQVDLVNSLKIRASWGKTGNQEFPPGSAQAIYAFQNNGVVIQQNSPNPDLKWQTDLQYDFGFDFYVLNNRLSGTIDYFHKNTSDLLYPSPPVQPSPPGSGVRWLNLDGNIINTGLEVQLGGEIIRGKKFSWNLSANVTFLHNSVSGLPAPIPTAFLGGPIETIRNGLPMQAFYTRKYLGLDKKTGFSIYQDDGFSSYYGGDPNPKTLLGITTTFRYSRISLTANMAGSYGQKIFNNTLMSLLNVGGIKDRNMALSVFKSPIKESVANPVTLSSRPIEAGDYLKMTNMTISYSFGDVAQTFKGMNVYVTAQNLFIITPYTGFDPEVNVEANVQTTQVPHLGLDFARYPSSRTFLLGINFSL
jgi:TonB-dependent starch-binding outer membrane protein SusC